MMATTPVGSPHARATASRQPRSSSQLPSAAAARSAQSRGDSDAASRIAAATASAAAGTHRQRREKVLPMCNRRQARAAAAPSGCRAATIAMTPATPAAPSTSIPQLVVPVELSPTAANQPT